VKRPARVCDIGTRTTVTAFEERHAGPDVDGLLVVAAEVVIESGEKELLNARGPIGLAPWGLVCWMGATRFVHPMKTGDSIMGQSPSWVNDLAGSRQLPTANAQLPTTPNAQ